MPSPCTVTGNLQTLTSGRMPQGTVTFQLANIGIGNPIMVLGVSVLPTLTYIIETANDGSFTTLLWGNDNIDPTNTAYSVTYRDYFGNQIGPVLYSITGSTANLNAISSISNTIPPVLIPGGSSGGSTVFTVTSESANFAPTVNLNVYLVTTGSSTIVATLTTAVGVAGQSLIIKKVDSGGGTVAIGTTSSQTIDGLPQYVLSNQWQFMEVVSDGANWQIIDNN